MSYYITDMRVSIVLNKYVAFFCKDGVGKFYLAVLGGGVSD